MSHSFVRQIIHFMWSTENQENFISDSVKNELYSYLTTLILSKSGKIFALGGTSDHLHLLVSLPGEISAASFMNYLKSYSSKWIKFQAGISPHFMWQKGYTAISINDDRIHLVSQYIKNDENRHISEKTTYQNELVSILKQQNISFQDQYLTQNSYSNVILHIVWSTYNRNPVLNKNIRSDLYSQIAAICTKNNTKILAIGGVEDHIHAMVTISKNVAISDLMREIKTSSAHWLKVFNYSEFNRFEWQNGYGAFTVSLPNVEVVKNYIDNQEEHHKKESYANEWNRLFLSFNIHKNV